MPDKYIPSASWFPGSLAERSAWCNTFSNVFTTAGGSLGFTLPEVAEVLEDIEDYISLANTTMAVENFASSIRQFRVSYTEDPIGTPHPVFPSATFAPPMNGRPAGFFQRLIQVVDRIRVHKNYTDEVAASLGIIAKTEARGPEAELKPNIKADAAALGGYRFVANVKRMGKPAYMLQIQREGSNIWEDLVVSTSNPTEYAITPTSAGKIERILVRAILYKGTTPVGVPSDPTYVTLNP